MSDIRLNEGYAPIYSKCEQELLYNKDFHGFFVLRLLGWHADAFGVCRPGPRRFQTFFHSADHVFHSGIARLQMREWVKIHTTVNTLRHTTEIDYQISPLVLMIRDENLDEAWRLWVNCTTPQIEQSENSDSFVNNQNQPESEAVPETSSKAAPPPDANSESGEWRAPTQAESQDRKSEEQKDQREAHNQRGTRTVPTGTTTKPPPRSARPPSTQRRKDFSTPLSPPLEALATTVKQAAPTHISQARQLVYAYRGEFVEAGLGRLRAAVAKGSVKNPFALLKTWLERDQIDPNQPLIVSRVSGDFMIES